MRIVFKTARAAAAAFAIGAAPVLADPSATSPIGLAAVLPPAGLATGPRAPISLARTASRVGDEAPSLASAFNPTAPARSPTAVDYSLARGGPHGSLGYICLDGMAPIAPREAAVTAGTDGGRLLGGSFLIPIP